MPARLCALVVRLDFHSSPYILNNTTARLESATTTALTSMSSFEDSKEALKAVVLQATQAAHALPAPSDIDFHRTLSTEFSEEVDAVSSKLLSLTSSLLHLVNDKVQELEEDDVLEEHSFEGKVVESVDGLLELVDGFLDEHKYGKKTAAVPVLPQTTQQPNTPTGGNNHSQSQTPVASSVSPKATCCIDKVLIDCTFRASPN